MIHLLNADGFYILHQRYILLFSEWPAVLAMKAGMSLKWIYLAYSMSHVIFLYMVFLIGHYWVRDMSLGILLLVTAAVSVQYTYFLFPIAEIMYGLPLLFLLASVINAAKYRSVAGKFMCAILLFWIIFSHPLVWVVFASWMAFLGLQKKYKRFVLGISFFFLAFVLLLTVIMPEDSPFTIRSMWRRIFTDRESQFSLQYIWTFIQENKISNLITLAVFLIFLKSGRFLEAGILFIMLGIGLFLIQSGSGPYTMIPLGITLIGLASMHHLDQKTIFSPIVFTILLAGVLIGNYQIINNSIGYVRAVNRIERLIDYTRDFADDKFIVGKANFGHAKIRHYSNTSLLLSSMRNQSSVFVFTDENALSTFAGNYELHKIPDSLFIEKVDSGFWNTYEINGYGRAKETEQMNSNHFRFERSGFKYLNKHETNTLDFVQSNIGVEVKTLRKRKFRNELFMEVDISNASDIPLYCYMDNQVYFQLYSVDERMYANDKNYLEVDILNSYKQVFNFSLSHFKHRKQIEVHYFKDKELLDVFTVKD